MKTAVPGQLSFEDLLGLYSEDIPALPGHYVYRLWAADGACLYVGVTGTWRPRLVNKRLREHRMLRGRTWLDRAVRRDFASFPSAEAALAEEKLQIAALQPIYNKRGIRAR